MILVLDASMSLAWCFERNRTEEAVLANEVLSRLPEFDVVIPGLWHTEVANALLVGERRKAVSEAQTIDFINRLSALAITTDETPPEYRIDVVMSLAREHGLTAYDATYLELALRSGAILATFDARLATAMRQAGGAVFGDEPERVS